MGKLVHRKPVLGWSVVLLSTLMLSSPCTATALLYALARAASAAEAGSPGTGVAPVPFPRRVEEKDALAAHSERPLTLRLDAEPDPGLSVVLPARSVLLIPDDALALAPLPAASDAAPSRPVAAAAPRAPPA
jgi:hypothetical protein